MLMSDVVAYAASLSKLDPQLLLDDVRRAPVVRARFALYAGLWLRSELRGRPPRYKEIGRVVGGRDHSTIVAGMRKAQRLMETDARFLEAVVAIATVTEEKLSRRTEAYCKAELQVLQALHQQQQKVTRQMDNPEYTEQRINEALMALDGAHGLEVYWNGDIVAPGEDAVFGVFRDEEDTGAFVLDSGGRFTLYAMEGRCRAEIGSARTYEGLADKIRDAQKVEA